MFNSLKTCSRLICYINKSKLNLFFKFVKFFQSNLNNLLLSSINLYGVMLKSSFYSTSALNWLFDTYLRSIHLINKLNLNIFLELVKFFNYAFDNFLVWFFQLVSQHFAKLSCLSFIEWNMESCF